MTRSPSKLGEIPCLPLHYVKGFGSQRDTQSQGVDGEIVMPRLQ